jgi:serine/threonine protein kinase
LVLEYIPLGSLEGLELSLEESMTVLCQGLSALADLHGREVPIVHRDIKPANILLQSRDPLHIKLTDFGLSKESNDLTTLCGTLRYLAPEVYWKGSYTPAVDIWSLGAVAFELACGRLDNRGYKGREWCEILVDEVNDWEDGDLIDLLSSAMIVMDPKLRRSARDCYREASRLTIASYERCLTPTPTSYGFKPVTYYPAEGQEVGDRNLRTLSNVVSTAEHFYLEDVVEQKLKGSFIVSIPDESMADPY